MCDAPDSSNVGYFFIGIFISIAGSCANNAGVNLQKLSIINELKKSHELQRPYVLQPLWMGGLLGVIFGGVADSLALGFAAASVRNADAVVLQCGSSDCGLLVGCHTDRRLHDCGKHLVLKDVPRRIDDASRSDRHGHNRRRDYLDRGRRQQRGNLLHTGRGHR